MCHKAKVCFFSFSQKICFYISWILESTSNVSYYYSLDSLSAWMRISLNYRGKISVALFWYLKSTVVWIVGLFFRCLGIIVHKPQPNSFDAFRIVQFLSMATLSINMFLSHTLSDCPDLPKLPLLCNCLTAKLCSTRYYVSFCITLLKPKKHLWKWHKIYK